MTDYVTHNTNSLDNNKQTQQLKDNHSKEAEQIKSTIRRTTIVIVILLLVILVAGYILGWFDSPEPLKNFALNMGWPGFILLGALSILENIFPVIPGNLPSIAIFLAYGRRAGFFWAIVFIIIGSILSFLLSRKYGEFFVKSFISPETYDKWVGKIDSPRNATKVALIGYWVPGIYDGAITMLLGLTKMSITRFTIILILSKPIPTYIYFMIATGLTRNLLQFIQNLFAVI